MISHKARAIHEQKCRTAQVSPSFIASNGWVQKFMARNGLSVRHRSTESQKDLDRLIDKLIAYILEIRQQRNRSSYSHSDISAMDETAVWQDMLSSTTVDNVGEKSIRLKTTGRESLKSPYVWQQRQTEQNLSCLLSLGEPRGKQSNLMRTLRTSAM